MNWNTYPESENLSNNVVVKMFDYLIDGQPLPYPAVGDTLTIEYPSNSRATGVITDISNQQIKVEINNCLSAWRLTDTTINNGKITLHYVVS